MYEVGIKLEVVKRTAVICLYFRAELSLINSIRSIERSYWHSGLRCWVVPDIENNRKRIKELIRDRSKYHPYQVRKQGVGSGVKNRKKINLPKADEVIMEKVERFRRWMAFRRYSPSTIRTYSEMVKVYLRFNTSRGCGEELGDGIQGFTNAYILPQELSYSYQNQLVNALKLFYREILKQEISEIQFQRPRPVYNLPNVLSKEEVKQILGVLRNIKHRAMLSTIYGCGLRRGELLNLRIEDIDSRRGILIIRQGKGNKDRIVPISTKNIELVREYYKLYRPVYWLFEGVRKGEKYDARSLQQVLKKAIYLAGIKKRVTLHWLRHSYATHLHESGIDIRYIQEILGHRSTRTTEIYTHVSIRSIQSIRSPLDDL